MSKLVVEELSGPQALSSLRPEWQALFNEANASPFLSWEWITAWHSWLGQGKLPRLLCAREGARLVGLLPLGEEARRWKGTSIKVRRLAFLGEGLGAADYLDVLSLPGYEQNCADALFDHIARHTEFDLLELEGLASDSQSLPWLTLRLGGDASLKCRLTPRYVCPQVRLDGSWEEVLGRTRRPDYFAYCLRRLRKLPGFDYQTVTNADEAAQAVERFLTLHDLSWAHRGGSDATRLPETRSFMLDVAPRLARAGWLRVEEIWIEGKCRASLFGIDVGERYSFYLSGYDPAWSKYSLGFALIGLSISGAVERGKKHYDFLRGAEPYKFEWANEARATVAAQLASGSLPSQLAIALDHTVEAARAAAQALLPAQALALWRRWRRARARKSAIVADAGDQLQSRETDERKPVETAA
jgi:CelD/BcsL family acetyltransferase involved in cellulose biosynthesis